jgi:flagellar motor switch protein FliN/FliY
MAGDESEGFLSQDDIDKALSQAGFETGGEAAAAIPAGISQADIDAAIAAAASEAQPPADMRLDSAGRPFDAVAAAMAAAIESEAASRPASSGGSAPLPAGAVPLSIPVLEPGSLRGGAGNQAIDLLRDVQLNVKIELGRSRMLVDDVLRLGEGSVVELDKLAGDPVDVFVNDRLVARGEVLVLNDNFCVRINDIVRQELEEAGQN